MINTKFKLTGEAKVHRGILLYRVEALKDFSDVKKGDKGGFVQHEHNLSIWNDCWIYDEAMVFGDSFIEGDAQIRDNAHIYNKSQVDCRAIISDDATLLDRARVTGDAQIKGAARLDDRCYVSGNAKIEGSAIIYDKAKVTGNAVVGGHTMLGGKVRVSGDAVLRGDVYIDGLERISTNLSDRNLWVSASNMGSRRDTITYNIESDQVKTGCFIGTLKDFKQSIENKYNGVDKTNIESIFNFDLYYEEYMNFINLCEIKKRHLIKEE